MSERPRRVQGKRVSATISPQAYALIKQLADGGILGADIPSVVRFLIYEQLQRHWEAPYIPSNRA